MILRKDSESSGQAVRAIFRLVIHPTARARTEALQRVLESFRRLERLGISKALPREAEVIEPLIGSFPVPGDFELPQVSKIRIIHSPQFLGLREDHFWTGTVFGPPQLTLRSRV